MGTSSLNINSRSASGPRPLNADYSAAELPRRVSIVFVWAIFGAIPEDRGNGPESTVTELPMDPWMRNKKWQKYLNKDQTTANRMTMCFIVISN